ncbi:hypothetical protein VZT92_020088 [Zoarces viviparus]|uniref:Uncharacterized protein n=1 Tax=Zoarces viviparus TaxID=48416 RepID=A0AAW1EHI3_ZOAVI
MPEAVHLGDCCGYGTAWREIYTFSPGFSRANESSPDAAGTATLSRARAPLSGRTHSRAPALHKEKRTLPGAPASFSGIVCVAALGASRRYLRHSRFGDLNPTPFRSAGGDVGHRPTLQNGVRPSLRTD